MLATILSAAEVAVPLLSTAAMPSVVPVRFWDGDRVDARMSRHGLTWRRADSMWHPSVSSGRRIGSPVEDFVIREYLERHSREEARYAPRLVQADEPLPGRPIVDRVDLETLPVGAVGAVPYIGLSGEPGGFWSLRDLAELRGGEEAAAYVPAVLPVRQVVEALAVLMEEERAEVAFHRPAARFYARYETTVQDESGRWRPEMRTRAYVLTGAESR